ncbi:hypothetical protein T07_618 [Trichinella nelsoni]|uniref:Uncharacterized protein n=1 Tax=Trichinella nelsoni TaxID=6336 RepID=A0A0V0SF23_9BILA|nr:hypothetical protein T07_618 [Trichinella nelsoni]
MVFKSSPPPAILYILHYYAQKRGVADLILTLPKISDHIRTIACSAITRLSVVGITFPSQFCRIQQPKPNQEVKGSGVGQGTSGTAA